MYPNQFHVHQSEVCAVEFDKICKLDDHLIVKIFHLQKIYQIRFFPDYCRFILQRAYY